MRVEIKTPLRIVAALSLLWSVPGCKNPQQEESTNRSAAMANLNEAERAELQRQEQLAEEQRQRELQDVQAQENAQKEAERKAELAASELRRERARAESLEKNPFKGMGVEIYAGNSTLRASILDDHPDADDSELDLSIVGWSFHGPRNESARSWILGQSLSGDTGDVSVFELLYGGVRFSSTLLDAIWLYPYVGAGGTLAMIENSDDYSEAGGFGAWADAGVALRLSKSVYLEAEIRKLWFKDVDDLDQVLFGIGFTF